MTTTMSRERLTPDEESQVGATGVPENSKPQKKRRLRGACDICRRQKIRCDSAKMPGNRCSNCVSFNSECTHTLSQHKGISGRTEITAERLRRKRATDSQPQQQCVGEEEDSARVLETAKKVVDGLLRQKSTFQAPEDHEALFQLLLQVARYARSLEHELDMCHRSHTSPSDRTISTAVSSQADVDEQHTKGECGIVINIQKLPEHLRRITMQAANHRFFGKNSSRIILNDAIDGARQENTSTVTRPEFWTPQPWEARPEPPALQIFPPDDLLWDLIEIYFTQLNIWCFILHRPTFEKSVSDGLHLRDHRFGATVLGVCALASKNSPDDRVFVPDTPGELSAGWQWFQQIRRPFSGPVLETASLYELQLCCLYMMFQQSGSNLEACWLLSGIGILHAQDIGVHERPDRTGALDLPDELLKRCLYHLSMFDAVASACFGRPRVAKASDFDLDLPVARFDECSGHAALERPLNLNPPQEKPSLMDGHIAYIQLIDIFTFTWRKADQPNYTGKTPLAAEVVTELDARLNKWAADIPEHLLWNPYMEDDVFFDQSAALYAAYYHVQILAHRPFIQAQRSSSSGSFKSLAICTNAARSCSHVVDVKTRRGFLPNSHTMKAAFDSAIVLLLNISGGARSGLSINTDRELVEVYKCMAFLRKAEIRWQNAGRFYDMLCELLIASKLPPPPALPPSSADPWVGNPYKFNRAEIQVSDLRTQNPELWPDHFFSLPMAAEDLGRLPIYESLDSTEMDIVEKIMADLTPGAFDPLPLNTVPPGANVLGISGDAGMSSAMDMDPYLSLWTPYFSNVDEMTQLIQNQQDIRGDFSS